VSTWQSLLRMFGFSSRKKDDEKGAALNEVPLSDTVAPATSSDNLVEAKELAPFVNALQSGLKVDPVKESRAGGIKETRLIDIHYQHSDPQVAAKIVNAVANVFVRSNLEKKNEANASTGEFLSKRVADLQSQIREGEEHLVTYAKSKEMLSLDQNQNTVVERLAGLNRELLEAEKDRTDAEAAYLSSKRPGASEAKAEDSAKIIDEYEAKLAELRAKREQLLVDNTEEWFEVKEVEQQIAILEKQLKDTRSSATKVIKTNLESKFLEAKAREDALRSAYNKQRGETMAQNEAAITYRIIQQEVETNKELLNGLLQLSKQNDVVLAGTPNNIHVVDYAIAPDEPVGPSRLRAVVLALVLSLGLSMAFAIFLEYLNDTVRSTEDVEKMLRLPTLAVIPAIGDLKGPARRLLPGKGGAKNAANWRNSNELLLDADARSPLAEAYRHLRTSVLLSTAGRPPKTLLITSSVPSEGKTTTAVNTAISLAQTGAKVLVIDADMRRPRLHALFDTEKRLGLSTILSSEMSEAEVFSMIEQHEQSGLYLLTAGPIPPNPAELIGSEQMRRLIASLEPTFNHIVIDSPPIASFTDGVLISSIVDGVLLVVHGGKSTRDVVRRSQQLLHDVGAKIFGVVLNNVHLRPHDYYYYQSYYQQSYYNRDPEEGLAGTQG
ncbi:MAG TPA: polysaccharide biosynthesis tyrosine autokinase, partial [Pyrinomonadaceae bacterium]